MRIAALSALILLAGFAVTLKIFAAQTLTTTINTTWANLAKCELPTS